MRTLKTLALAAAATAVLPLAGMAQDTTPKSDDPTVTPPAASSTMQNSTTPETTGETTTQHTNMTPSTMGEAAVITAQSENQVLSDSYIGANVVARSTEGTETVGEVSELLLDENDKIVGVVVDVGGFLGIAAKPVGLAWSGLTEEMADGDLMLKTSLTREELEAAPEFKTLAAVQVEEDRELIENESAPIAPTVTQ